MDLKTIGSSTNWNTASEGINTNFARVNVELEKLKDATTRDKGYYQTAAALANAHPTAPAGARAFVGYVAPYKVYTWSVTSSAWVDTGETITDASVELGDYYTKMDVDALITAIYQALGTKFGALYVDATTGLMSVFATEEDKQKWLADPSQTSLVLTSVNVGVGGGGGGGGGGSTAYQLLLRSSEGTDTTKTFSTTDTNAFVSFYFIAKQKAPDSDLWEEMSGESISYTIEVATGGSAYTQVSQGYLLAGATAKFDVRRFLVAGKSTLIRIKATGDLTGLSAALSYNYSLTSMALAPANFTWYEPFIEGNGKYALGGMTITGDLDKVINVKVSSQTLAYTKLYTQNLGTRTWTQTSYVFEDLVFPTTGTGVYSVEIWLDASGVESEHLHYNIMCVSAADRYSARLVTVANVASEAVNYADNKLFSYAIYNRGGSTGNPTVVLTKTEGGSTSTFYSETLEGVTTPAAHDFTTSIEVASSSSDVSIAARLTYGNEMSVSFQLDNSASFPATSGATFYMNPAARSNSQTNYLNIVNEITSSQISAVWDNMAWAEGTDGWTIDNDGRKCLRLPATTRCTVNLKPMSSFTSAKTFEFVFKAENAADYTEPIITICDNAGASNFRGIKILPDKIIVHSRVKQNDLVQSYPFQDEKTIHILVTIIKNYNVNYGNLCKIYVNSVGVCSFSFDGTDNWTNEGNLTFGSNTADLLVYGFRYYEIGFGKADAFRNFLASLPDLTTKRAEHAEYYKVLNDNEVIDYDVIKDTENTMVIEMLNGAELPQYGFDKKYEAQCNFWLNIFNEIPNIDPAGRKLSGEYLNQTISGQGTTSMNYYLWNQRWKMDDDYNIRITAKKNYASSMQSHKMGATALYNDTYKALGLSNGSTGRVAVYQYPVYGFLKRLKEGTTNQYYYTFIGLFTVGPDKGDKLTFGYKDSGLKDTVINLEGTDHNPAGVGFDYPWAQLKYIKDNEAFGARLPDGTYEKAYEVGNSGTAKTEEAIQKYLDEEFALAYNVVFENSTMIIGTTTPIKTINSDVLNWGLNKDADGHLYSRYMVWVDGEYILYYLSKETNTYVSTGINLRDQLGSPVATTVEAKNEWFKARRRENFKANMEKYWDLQDLLFHDVFLLIIAASDNLKKNFYPQKFKKLADGGRWGFRQDDLDSIFRTDNQAHQTKGYSVEQFDWTDENKTAYVFKGEDSALHRLLYECYPEEINQMGYRILEAMASLSDTGTNAIDQLMGCFDKYFFNKAQDYFTKSAYNEDAAIAYEDAWPLYESGVYDVDTHPLDQSLGGNEESERGWLWLRMIYCMSMFSYGPFKVYTDNSLGRITYRPQYAQSFTLTPAVDLYPAILPGAGTPVRSTMRIKAGESYTLPAVGGGNTNVYISASDYIRDIGDLRTLAVDSANGTMSVGGKRLQRLKLGDADAASVTSTLAKLTITSCPSLTIVDARNVKGLSETIDLTKCPRIEEAYFGGTAVAGVIVPSGSKIRKLQLGDQVSSITLVKLPRLTQSGFTYGDLSKVEYLRVENVGFKEFYLLRELYGMEGSVLRDVRVMGVDEDGTADDIDMLANIYNDLDKDGNPHRYNGIDDKGDASELLDPVIEGTLRIASAVYEDTYETVSKYYKSLNIIVSGGRFIRFADAKVLEKLLSKGVGSNGGVTNEQAMAVTSLSDWFKQNKEITSFDELRYFTGITALADGAYTTNAAGYLGTFNNCTSLVSVRLPETITNIGNGSFAMCTSLSEINIPEGVTCIGATAFKDTQISGDIRLPNVTSIWGWGAFYNTKITGLHIPLVTGELPARTASYCTELKSVTFGSGLTSFADGVYASNVAGTYIGSFFGCTSLGPSVTLPNGLTKIGSGTFGNCTSLERINIPESVQTLGGGAFVNCTSLYFDLLDLPNLISIAYDSCFKGVQIRRINFPRLKTLPNTSVSGEPFGSKAVLEEATISDELTTIPRYFFYNYAKLAKLNLAKSITTIGNQAFEGSIIEGVVNLPNLTSLGTRAFIGTKITSVKSLGSITALADGGWISAQRRGTFALCDKLQDVVLPETLTNIGYGSFSFCSAMTSINIPSAVTRIGEGAFQSCSAPIVLNTPNLATLAGVAFQDSGIVEVVNLGVITTISNGSSTPFYNAKKLKKVVWPSSLTTMGQWQFYGCESLDTVVIPSETIITLGNQNAFQGTNANLAIYVANNLVETYKAANNWSAHSSRIFPIAFYEMGGATNIVTYDRLVGNASDYVTLPIAYKAGWSYKYSVNVIADLITTQTMGVFSEGGIHIRHSTYREMVIDGVGTSQIWSSFGGLETLEITPSGILKNGASISTAALTADKTTNISIFKGGYYAAMGNFVHFRSLEVWNAEGTLVHKYIPCKVGDAVGLLDEVEYTFHPSASNGLGVQND